MSPAPKKSERPGLTDALDEVDAAQRRWQMSIEDAAAVIDAAVGQRALAVRRALDLGATLRSLGERLGVSPETVRAMAADGPWHEHQRLLVADNEYAKAFAQGRAGKRNTTRPDDPRSDLLDRAWRLGAVAHRQESETDVGPSRSGKG